MAVDTITDPTLDLAKELADQLIEHDGKLGAKRTFDARVPLLRDYVQRKSVVVVPAAVHRSFYGFKSGMLGNDTIGDCVIAAIYHALIHVYHVLGLPVPDPDTLTKFAVETYSAITGYDPNDPSTDQGTDPVAAWTYWQKTGIPLPDGTRHKILGFVQILPHDGANLRRGIYEFDSVGLSLAMPTAWQGAKTWDIGGDPNSDPAWQPGGWGGHEVLGVSFDVRNIAVWTWGGVKLLTWAAWGTYGELGLTQVSQDQIGKGGLSETSIDLSALEADLPQL